MKKIALILFSGALIFSLSACNRGTDNNQNPGNDIQTCGIEQCHGLEVTCGANVPEACNELYQVGDFCHLYVTCNNVEGECQMVNDEWFLLCKSCVDQCYQLEGEDIFNCEEQCRQKMKELIM